MSIYNAVLEAQYTFIVEINLKHCAYVQVLKDLLTLMQHFTRGLNLSQTTAIYGAIIAKRDSTIMDKHRWRLNKISEKILPYSFYLFGKLIIMKERRTNSWGGGGRCYNNNNYFLPQQ